MMVVVQCAKGIRRRWAMEAGPHLALELSAPANVGDGSGAIVSGAKGQGASLRHRECVGGFGQN